IMGQNIGTCITAIISGVGASRNARRASLVHLYFNLIGTTVFMVVFYGLNAFIHFEFLSGTANGAIIAIIHSIFNIAATLLLLPAAKLIEKLAYITIPQLENENEDDTMKVLDERFLERPAFAVAQCKTYICDMAQQIENAVGLCVVVQKNYDEERVQKVMQIESDMDIQEDEISTYLTKLSSKALTETDSKRVSRFAKCIIDIERISDYAKGIVYAQKKMNKNGDTFSRQAKDEAQKMFDATQEIVECTVRSLIHDDHDMAMRIDPLADVISTMKKEIRKNHNSRLASGECSVELGMSLLDIVTSLERIAGHCSNIAEEKIAGLTDEYGLHQYAKNQKESSAAYQELVEFYKEKYSCANIA
ncbi:MAG: Na/Pi cotransporter family protein, partial [Eubacterium sp.]|nr:Na/Pi cotransporter family protein [Eubacterium sp.]